MAEVPRAPVDSRETGRQQGEKVVRGKSVLTTGTRCAWIDARWSEMAKIEGDADRPQEKKTK